LKIKVITREAESRRADLIFMRSRRRPFATALPGSTAEAVSRLASSVRLAVHCWPLIRFRELRTPVPLLEMTEQLHTPSSIRSPSLQQRVRDWFAASLGVSEDKKEEIYLQISRSATLIDFSHWSQVLFSAGIATLGLALNSPAVIIGAMLISPLMGPILANGLALAAGDLVLGTRAAVNLFLSCLVAIFFAVVLVTLLPFKEITAEIASRTQPNTLDLVIALFSGAVGSIAICKEVKGIVTSIPGVAIAVALMPPLCVVGYGMGITLSLNPEDGARIARGGMLLFLTNLVAIIFTAMVVFVALHINTEHVKQRVLEWQQNDRESEWVRRMFGKLPLFEKLRIAGSLPGRFAAIVITILLILVPLTQSFLHLKNEIAKKQQENRVRVAAIQLWEENFSRMPDGEPRCYLGQLTLVDREGVLALLLRVFTIKPYTTQERADYTRLVAARIDRPVQSIVVRLIEIPTVSSELLTRAREGVGDASLANDEKRAEDILTIGQLQSNYAQVIETALGDLRLPAPATFVDYEVTTYANTAPRINLVYLSEREIEADGQTLLVDEVRRRFENPEAHVSFERLDTTPVSLTFGHKQTQIETSHAEVLDRFGRQLQRFASLRIDIATGADRTELEGLAEERGRAIVAYLTDKWTINPERIELQSNDLQKREATLEFLTGESASGQRQRP
jgi:uncharacterized hydrophobic protein (TIGR00271 family)